MRRALVLLLLQSILGDLCLVDDFGFLGKDEGIAMSVSFEYDLAVVPGTTEQTVVSEVLPALEKAFAEELAKKLIAECGALLQNTDVVGIETAPADSVVDICDTTNSCFTILSEMAVYVAETGSDLITTLGLNLMVIVQAGSFKSVNSKVVGITLDLASFALVTRPPIPTDPASVSSPPLPLFLPTFDPASSSSPPFTLTLPTTDPASSSSPPLPLFLPTVDPASAASPTLSSPVVSSVSPPPVASSPALDIIPAPSDASENAVPSAPFDVDGNVTSLDAVEASGGGGGSAAVVVGIVAAFAIFGGIFCWYYNRKYGEGYKKSSGKDDKKGADDSDDESDSGDESD